MVIIRTIQECVTERNRQPLKIRLRSFRLGLDKRISEMKTGTVKWFNKNKGFGFIVPEDGSKDLFVHYRSLQTPGVRFLSEGQKVSFQVESSPKGSEAKQVVVEET